jgi:hypothetical protein
MNNTYEGEILGGLNGQLVFGIVPEKFLWSLEDNFGQARQNQFLAVRPDNRENINQLRTGPDLTLNLGSTMSLLLSGRYALTQYEESPLDNKRVTETAGLRRQLSRTSSLSLMATRETTEYDNPTLVNEYEVQSLFARFVADGARTALSMDVGYTQLTGLGEDHDGVLLQLSMTRQLSAASTITLGAGSQFSNGGDVFRRLQSVNGVVAEPNAAQPTQDAFENRFMDIGWVFNRNRTSLRLTASYNEEAYEQSVELDRSYVDLRASITRRVSRVSNVHIGANYRSSEYDNQIFDDKELGLLAGFDWSLGRELGLGISYQRRERQGEGAIDESTENQVWLRLTYEFGREP